MSERPTIRLLLLEDNPLDVFLMEALLDRVSEARVQLHHAERLSGALKILREDTIDLVLTDLSLPDCDGMDTIRALRRQAGCIPVVVLTGLDDPAIAPCVQAAGAHACLSKDRLTLPAFALVIDEVLQRKDPSSRR